MTHTQITSIIDTLVTGNPAELIEELKCEGRFDQAAQIQALFKRGKNHLNYAEMEPTREHQSSINYI